MDFKILLEELKGLNLPKGEFAVFMSGCLAVRGLREANDIDVITSESLWKRLVKRFSVNVIPGGKSLKPSPNIEIANPAYDQKSHLYSNDYLIKTADNINGVLYVNLNIMREIKLKLGREKDLNDVKLIDGYFNSKVNSKEDLFRS